MNDVLTPPSDDKFLPGCDSSIAGVPTTAGTYEVVVTVSDTERPPQRASAAYTITVAP